LLIAKFMFKFNHMILQKSKITFTLLFFFASMWAANANNIPKEIITCFKTGNASALSGFINSSLELQVLDNENVYSKDQAEQILKKFFNQNKPVDFVVLHQSGKDGAYYAIGTLHTVQGKYRVYFLIKEQNGKRLIHQLSIKKENA
jgi:hypothetical protein